MPSNCARVTCVLPSNPIAEDDWITNRSSWSKNRFAIRYVANPIPAHSSNKQPAKIRPHFVAGNPRNRIRTPARRRSENATSSSYGSSAKSSLKSRPNFLFCEVETRRGPADSEAYSRSGASSTAVPRFENTSLCRKHEQGRENRHPENNPPTHHPGPSSSGCTLSGTHPFAPRVSSNTAPACETLPAPSVRTTSPAFASRASAPTASGTDLA